MQPNQFGYNRSHCVRLAQKYERETFYIEALEDVQGASETGVQ